MSPPSPPEPARRLAVTPSAPNLAGLRARLVRAASPRFPWRGPDWPDTVARPVPERRLGVDFETEWARRPPARVARVLLGELFSRPAVAALARPRVAGLDRLEALDEPVIFAANHASHLDTPLLVSVLPERWRHHTVVAGAADYFFDTKLKGAVFALTMNVVPVERQRVSRRSADRATRLLNDGWSLLIFPEGGRSPDGWSQVHQPGAAWLALRTGRPIVPVHVEGTRHILPKGARRVRPGRVAVTFGRPLRPEPGGDPRRLAARLEAAVGALADEHSSDWWAATRRAASGTTPSLQGPGAGAWRRSWALGPPRREAGRSSRGAAPWPGDR